MNVNIDTSEPKLVQKPQNHSQELETHYSIDSLLDCKIDNINTPADNLMRKLVPQFLSHTNF